MPKWSITTSTGSAAIWSAIDLNVPTQMADALGHLVEISGGGFGIAAFPALEIYSDPAHALCVKFGKFGIGDVGGHDRDPARGVAELRHRIQHASIVGTVERRLDQHIACDAKPPAHREEVGDGCFRRRIGPLRHHRISRAWAHDMNVAVASPCRHVGYLIC
jgi:hypothetical protein